MLALAGFPIAMLVTPPLLAVSGGWDWLTLTAAVLCLLGVFVFALIEEALHHFSHPKLLGSIGSAELRTQYAEWLKHIETHWVVARLLKQIVLLLALFFCAMLAADETGKLTLVQLAIVSGIVYCTVLVFNRIIAHYFGSTRAETILLFTLPWLDLLRVPLWPLLAIVRLGWKQATRMFGEAKPHESDLEAEIIHIMEQAQTHGVLDTDDKSRIERLIDFKDSVVEEVMTPRTDMISVEVNTPLTDAMQISVASGYTRLPVYEGHRDHVVGVFNTRDILPLFVDIASRVPELPAIRDIMREPFFVPEGKDLGDLLDQMRKTKVSMAVVLDEYSGTSGLITIEDIMEEIVGPIHDEFDSEPPEEERVQQVDEMTWDVDARLSVDDANERMNLSLPEEEDFETVGGFLFFAFGSIPKKGDMIETHGCRFTVLESEARKITKVRVQRLPVYPHRDTSRREKAVSETDTSTANL